MKTVLIIHGIGGHAGIHWQQWLHDELTQQGHYVLMPDLPDSAHPDRQTWHAEIQKTLEGVKLDQLVIVGHSLGVTTALDFIELSDDSIDGLLSVSGFTQDYGAEFNSYFLREKFIDFHQVEGKLRWTAAVYGDNDPYVTQGALKHLAEALDVQPVIIAGGGHLNTEAGFNRLPQLLDILKQQVAE